MSTEKKLRALGVAYLNARPLWESLKDDPRLDQLISLVKDTSLASTILVTELLRAAQVVAAPTFEFFALYGTAAVYYWIICLVLSFGQSRLERRLERHVAR